MAKQFKPGETNELRLYSKELERSLEEKERALAERERELADLVENAGDPIFTVARDGRMLTANEACARETGWPREELLRLSFLAILTPASRSALACHLADIVRGEAASPRLEIELVHKEGQIVPAEASLRVIFDDQRRVRQVQCIARVLSERKELEERRIAEARLAAALEVAAGAAHELFQPLTGITGLIDLLGSDSSLGPDLRRTLDLLREQAGRMTAIVRRMNEVTEGRQLKTAPYPGGERIADLGPGDESRIMRRPRES